MKTKPKIIVITGAESTGKSELAMWLSRKVGGPYIPEYAREYVEKLNRKYNYRDVETIAKIQVEGLNQLKNTEHQYIFVDTWLIITKVWFEVVFEKKPDWLETEIKTTPIDLFLLCDTDLPWEPDLVRENGGEKRIMLQNNYIQNIKNYNFKFEIVNGKNEQRFQNALNYIKQLENI